MVYKVSKADKKVDGTVYLTASKSESNRVLLIQALCEQQFRISNLAESMDTQIMAEILKNELSGDQAATLKALDVEVSYYTGPGGTTIRFLAAFFAGRPGTRILTGSERMNKRPIKPLVDALRQLGAKISYLDKEGFTPIRIEGTKLKGGAIEMDAGVSSQFITAVLLIAPTLEGGLQLTLNGWIASRSYINMTLGILEHFGVKHQWKGNTLIIEQQAFQGWDYHVESDWSSASYWYEIAALSEESNLKIRGLKRQSLQGDSVIANMFEFFGVHTKFVEDGVQLSKTDYRPEVFDFDFSDYPDVAQTAAVTASALKIPMQLNGLYTLHIKETDRIEALIKELSRIGVKAEDTGKGSLLLKYSEEFDTETADLESDLEFETYQDHRMAMSFAPLALRYPEVKIQEPGLVRKSYPDFWNDMRLIGFNVEAAK